MFLVECQSHTLEEDTTYAKEKGLTLPIPVNNDCDFDGYKFGNGLPYAYVIGPDGKVAWQGPKGYEAVIDEQLKRIKYPGLGKLEVAKDLEKAATEFGAGNIAKAREEALKVKVKKGSDAAVAADADYIVARADARAAKLAEKVEAAKVARRYHEAVAILEQLSGKAYEGMEAATKAKADLEALKADKAVKAELKAWDALAKLQEANVKAKDDAVRREALLKFAEKNEGMAAAEEARKLVQDLK
ncbi:MAG: hypothetical protein IT463_13440 [Planctomycetes bacterium]|nr:hypothetical protein [Planctomycetota bacterium]